MMKKGINRFNYFLDQLQDLMVKAGKQKNPALWLYSNNVRTPLFMLEALSRLYADLHNKNKFTKLKEQFKLLEDTIGIIDYYDSFAKEFSQNKKIPASITNYLQAQTREKIQSLNEILLEKKWISPNNNRIAKIKNKLAEIKWQYQSKEINLIYKYYQKDIKETVSFVKASKFHFDNVEADVHELRRKLRWLSIYAQALQGAIQLTKAKKPDIDLKKYLTKEVTSSPFNIMPAAGDNKYFLLLDQNYFYALSWIIAELGNLKDNGLRVIALKEALQQTGITDETKAFKKAYQLSGPRQLNIQVLLDQAEAICKTYFEEKNLEQLVIGTGSVC